MSAVEIFNYEKKLKSDSDYDSMTPLEKHKFDQTLISDWNKLPSEGKKFYITDAEKRKEIANILAKKSNFKNSKVY